MRYGALLTGVAALATCLGCTEQHERESREASAATTKPAPSSNPPEQKGTSKVEMPQLASGPMSVFEMHCARCHGPYGTFYGQGFGQMPEHDLEEVVVEMLEGPAGLETDETSVAAMMAYHRALGEANPFLCVTNGPAVLSGKADTLHGEVTPDSTVEIRTNDQTRKATVDGHTWSISDPPDAPFEIHARNNQGETTLSFPGNAWSHDEH